MIALALAGLLGLLAACTGTSNTDAATRGTLTPDVDLSGLRYRVGGKEFPEQRLLCELAGAAIEAAGGEVEYRCGRPGTQQNRAALLAGEIDLYWEYNGTAWSTMLNRSDTAPTDTKLFTEQVRALDHARGVTWLDPTPMSNSYALAVSLDNARRLNLHTLSDVTALAAANPAEATFCLEPEYATRADGWPLVQQQYGIKVAPGNLIPSRKEYIGSAIAAANPCLFGDTYATDGAVATNQLYILADDRNVSPKYNAAVTIRNDAFAENPRVADLLNPIAHRLTQPTITELNARAAAPGADPRIIARDWLRAQQWIS